ncbi:C-C motif chemokine 1 [Meriones unguiculatus]|uniref:C-C motif chemokine 1 n=1 Tax=Meriones unguiculatus TaxID=10047 RepID=UPI000B4EE71C|nr:C-C motif chemokine 1 [Meriones unguiculatus]
MKLITMALMCLLLAAVWLQDVESKSLHVSSANCCFNSMKRMPSLKSVKCYKETSSTCGNPAVIFKMKKGRESCALKTSPWLDDYLKKVRHC